MSRDSIFHIAAKPVPADAIFVFAGREHRKRFGVELYRAGYAPLLILSVGRFEWRRFEALGLHSDGGLVEQVATVEPVRRHFFVQVRAEETKCEPIPWHRLGTMTEARALAARLPGLGIRRLMVVSSREHLPRCVLSMRAFLDAPCELVPVASPPESRPADRGASGAREWAKLGGYSALLALRGLSRRFS